MKQSFFRARNKRRLSLLFAASFLLALAVALFSSCASLGELDEQDASLHIEEVLAAAKSAQWEELAAGIWSAELPNATCGTEFAAIKIRLKSVSIVASLPEGKEENRASFKGEFAADFAARTGSTVAINMTPFAKKGDKMFPTGIYINGGTLISPSSKRYAAIFFFKDGRAAIAPFQDESIQPLTKNAEFAFGGFWQVLDNGELVDFPNIRNSRMVLGLDRAGETLFILAAVKSSLLGSGSGISFTEGAALIKALGAASAIQMDGGSSTCLAVNGKQILPSKRFFFIRKNKKTAVNAGFIGRSF